MFYDLNIPWKPSDPHLPQTLAFLHELGYNTIALNHTISGKIPTDLTNPIPTQESLQSTHRATLDPIFKKNNCTILRRITLVLTEISHQNAKLASLASAYDLLALKVTDEKSLTQACGNLECDIITFDLTQRFPFYFFKHQKMLQVAIQAGKRLEICYSTGLMGDAKCRVNLISNATQLIRATKGRGLLMSSGGEGGGGGRMAASAAAGLRGPWDVINLAAVWGLGQERGFEAMSKEPRGIVVRGKLKRTGYRGAVDVIYGGEKPAAAFGKDAKEAAGKGKQKWKQGGQHKKDENQQQGQKRKAEGEVPSSESGEQPMSKRQQKKLAHAARVANGTAGPAATSSGPPAASAG